MYTITVDLDKIFDEAIDRSLYFVQSLTAKEKNVTPMDEMSISNDDRKLCDIFTRKACSSLYSLISAYGKNLIDPDTLEEILSYQFSDTTAIYKVEFPTGWDANLIDYLTDQMQEYIVAFMLNEWFKTKGMAGVFYGEIESARSEINSVIHRRKTAYKRSTTILR